MDNESSKSKTSRRNFLQHTAGTAATAAGLLSTQKVFAASDKPTLLGGTPAHAGNWPTWPISGQLEETKLLEVLRSGDWNRYRGGEQGTVCTAADFGGIYRPAGRFPAVP